jgi:hypothetical protein
MGRDARDAVRFTWAFGAPLALALALAACGSTVLTERPDGSCTTTSRDVTADDHDLTWWVDESPSLWTGQERITASTAAGGQVDIDLSWDLSTPVVQRMTTCRGVPPFGSYFVPVSISLSLDGAPTCPVTGEVVAWNPTSGRGEGATFSDGFEVGACDQGWIDGDVRPTDIASLHIDWDVSGTIALRSLRLTVTREDPPSSPDVDEATVVYAADYERP